MLNVKTKDNTGDRKFDIINSIIDTDINGAISALEEDPNCVNDEYKETGMNAAMLAAYWRMPEFLTAIFDKGGQHLDFGHLDADGDDLHAVALASLHGETVKTVTQAYIQYAPHIANNPPNPSY